MNQINGEARKKYLRVHLSILYDMYKTCIYIALWIYEAVMSRIPLERRIPHDSPTFSSFSFFLCDFNGYYLYNFQCVLLYANNMMMNLKIHGKK